MIVEILPTTSAAAVSSFINKRMKSQLCALCSKPLNTVLFSALDKFDNKTYKFYQCINCTLVQIQPLPLKTNLKKTYSYSNNISFAKSRNKQFNLLFKLPLGRLYIQNISSSYFKDKFNKINKLHSHGKILDVGCGTGSFLTYFPTEVWNITGIEINHNLAKIAKSKLENAEICSSTVESTKLPPDSFNIITLWHVFEHLDNPKKILKSFRKIISSDGYLIMEMPNGNSFFRKIFKNNWQLLLLPQHLFFWTEKSLRTALNESRFEVYKIEYPLSPFNPTGIISFANLLRSKGIQPYILSIIIALILSPINIITNLFLPQKYRDNLFITARPIN